MWSWLSFQLYMGVRVQSEVTRLTWVVREQAPYPLSCVPCQKVHCWATEHHGVAMPGFTDISSDTRFFVLLSHVPSELGGAFS